MKHYEKKLGYTLVELSIVIIIIALILGGLFSSALLVKQSYLRSVMNDFQAYKASYNTFIATYKKPPGDIEYATKFFDSALCASTDAMCNGDGNGLIIRAIDDTDEVKAAMKHLQLAGLLNASLALVVPGGDFSDTAKLVPGFNVPKSKLSGGGYMMINQYAPAMALSAGQLNISAGLAISPFPVNMNALYIGKMTDYFDDNLVGGVMSGVDAYNIDVKLDDGVSTSGNIRTINAILVTSCVSSGAYVTNTDALSCVVGYSLE